MEPGEDVNVTTQDQTGGYAPPTNEDGGLLGRLRAQRAEQLQEKTLVLPVPGWANPSVLVRYKPVEWERLSDLMGRATPDAAAELSSNLDALVAACDALLVKDAGEEPVELADLLRAQGESVEGSVRFDEVAVDVLGLGEVSSARETVLAVFAGAVSPEVSVLDHALRLGRWMGGAEQEVDDSLAGG